MAFVKGLDLSRALFGGEVEPLMARRFPALPYAAATLGMCSEVLGLDDEVSTDHEWGPRVSLFLEEEDHAHYAAEVSAALREALPDTFMGLRMAWRTPGVAIHDTASIALYHVSVRTLSQALSFCGGAAPPPGDLDWLRVSEQHLLEFTAGGVYRDDLGALTRSRAALRHYPPNVLRFLLMGEWGAVNRRWFPIGRMGARGDVLGVRLQAARAAQHLMRIAYLVSGQYSPYEKWFGTLFGRLPVAAALKPILEALLSEARWQAVEERICEATVILLERQNALGIAEAVEGAPELLDDGRHHVRGGFRRAWSALREALQPPLDTLLETQVSWLHERSLILAGDEVGKWSLLLQP